MTKTMPKEHANKHVIKLSPAGVLRTMNFHDTGGSTYNFSTLPILPKHSPRVMGALTPQQTPPTLELVTQVTAENAMDHADQTEHSSCSLDVHQTEYEDSDVSNCSRCSTKSRKSLKATEPSVADLVRQPQRPLSGLSEAAAIFPPPGEVEKTAATMIRELSSNQSYDTDDSSQWHRYESRRAKRKSKKKTKSKSPEHDIIAHAPPTQSQNTGAIPKVAGSTQHQHIQKTSAVTNTYMTEVVGKDQILPIVIKRTYAGNMAQLNAEFKAKYQPYSLFCTLVRTGTSIQVSTRNDYKNLIRFLEEKNVPFHILPDNGKVLNIVIRGIPTEVGDRAVFEALQAKGIEPLKVSNLRGKNGFPYPMYSVTIPDSVQNRSIYDLSGLCDYVVRVENERTKGPTQCWNCQQFLHTSNYCRLPPRCRLCAGEHPARICGLTRDQPRRCANCHGNHPADSVACRFRRAAMQATTLHNTHNTQAQTSTRPETPPNRTSQRAVGQPTQSPRLDYSTIVTQALVHAPDIPDTPSPPKQQRLPRQSQQPREHKDTQNTQPLDALQRLARSELHRMERERQQAEHNDLQHPVADRDARRQESLSSVAPSSTCGRRHSGSKTSRPTGTITDKREQDMRKLKEQLKKQQLQLETQQRKLMQQQLQLTEWQARLTAETERLRERQLLFESELNRFTSNRTKADKGRHANRENIHSTRHTENRHSTRHTSLTYRFSKEAGLAANSLRQTDPNPNIPRLLNALYDSYEILRADPQYHTLPEMVMRFLATLWAHTTTRTQT